ncbi:MAG: 16S rRNA (uracil(1498)-N(3))-methyltransferase [Gammaproteobacteria bacterium]|jgi:16S rRNA (uracil1498-N3)-methyltransferase
MRIPRLHIPGQLVEGESLALDERTAHHVTRVLRLRCGSLLKIFNGQGREHEAKLVAIRHPEVTVVVGREIPVIPESPLPVMLAQGIPRGERMDFILQKAVELGVSGIQPLWMQRSQSRTRGERLVKRQRHWRAVMISACEQSGRSTLPVLETASDFEAWLSADPVARNRILLHPGGEHSLAELEPLPGSILLLAGPEGGISDAEHTRAICAGFTSVRLGPRILRTETAAMAALACLQLMWGDYRQVPLYPRGAG